MATTHYFLQIQGVDGESTDAKHKGWIDVESWSWGETWSGAGAISSGTGAGGKVGMHDLTFSAHVSRASPKLFVACAAGQHLAQAKLAARRAGQPLDDHLVWTLTDVRVMEYATGGSHDDPVGPLDRVALRFAKVLVEYRTRKPDGTLDVPVKAGWDVALNHAI